VITYRQIQLDKMKNVEVHTGQRLGADDVLKYGADKVIVTTGFAWSGDGTSHITMAPIPGVDASQARFLTPEQVMDGKPVGERVVVLDAENYFTGIGMAEMMADAGKQVSLVTQTGNPARITEFTVESPNIHRMLHEKGIRSVTNSWVEECEVGNEVKVKVFNLYRDGYRRSTDPVSGELPRQAGDEHEIITADTVIVVTARASNDALYRELKARKSEWAGEGIAGIYLAGDAYAPRLLADAIYDGHRIAREFEEPNPRRSKPFLRERMIWGHDISPTA
jgi:dimethylamine/trimethylamine dehydrogenase